MGNFPVHGDLQLEVQDRLLIIRMMFPINDEATALFVPRLQECYAQMPASGWGSVLVCTGTPLMTDVNKTSAIESIQTAKNYGLKVTGLALLEADFRNLMHTYWDSIYREVDLRYQFFDHQSDAIRWVSEELKT